MSACDLPTLQATARANKFTCLDPKTQVAVLLQLLCNIKNEGVASVNWCSIMHWPFNVIINGGAGVFAPMTSFDEGYANGFTYDLAAGTMTNSVAGYYKFGIHLSGISLDSSAMSYGDLFVNGVRTRGISFASQFEAVPRTKDLVALGVTYLQANSTIDFRIQSSGASGISVARAQYTVGAP